MREYAKVAPTFWTGTTGKKIRSYGRDTQVLALYLITSPHANMLGLYYMPIPFICHETGLTLQGASKALQSLSEAGFCAYDATSECVWVFEMAAWQIDEALKQTDNRVKGINKEYQSLPNNIFLQDFYNKYRAAFHLEAPRGLQGASKGLRSQEQEQEQEQEKEIDSAEQQAASAPAVATIPLNDGSEHPITQAEVDEWSSLYPVVDVLQELKNMRGWASANPKKRKTKSGVMKFINSWLAREQDKGGKAPPTKRTPGYDPDTGYMGTIL